MTDENSIEVELANLTCLERLVVVIGMPMTPTRIIITGQPRLLD